MKFQSTSIEGLYSVTVSPHVDARGSFTRMFAHEELAGQGIAMSVVHCNVSMTEKVGSIRGLHWQASPHGEMKQVWCMKGAIYDVVVDMRPDSPTFGTWEAFGLREQDTVMLVIPKGCAHGFQTLEEDCQVFYWMSHHYVPDAARGVRYNDPVLAIPWPLPVAEISSQDAALPLFKDLSF